MAHLKNGKFPCCRNIIPGISKTDYVATISIKELNGPFSRHQKITVALYLGLMCGIVVVKNSFEDPGLCKMLPPSTSHA